MKPSLRRTPPFFFASLSIGFATLVLITPSTTAQSPRPATTTARSSALMPTRGRAITSTPQKEIARLVREISARNIEKTIHKLVSFGTRNTLSAQDDPNRGIGAARDWLFSEFSRVADQSGGRMTVEKQSFEQPKAARVPTPTMITNIVATLKGTQSESAARTYIVSGHYDSMCTSPTDAVCDAPGANDDASGTVAVLEMARVMARYKFDATIIFMAVAGEEQGLLGSTYAAEQAKVRAMDIE
ncbi:MAG TPA: M28 family peptidase, partial [Pyrinomonadaceae bacterium]|nr:M28 family peptidase [Pyrinomonadaceae bacterium]